MRSQNIRNPTRAMTATPPIVPPTIAPTGVELPWSLFPLLLEPVLPPLSRVMVVLGISDDDELLGEVLLVRDDDSSDAVLALVRAGGVASSVSIPP